MTEPTIDQAIQVALHYHHAGKMEEAEDIYRNILDADPNHVNAMHYLGVLLNRQGQHDEAIGLIRRAIGLRPDEAIIHNNLGVALKDCRQVDAAIPAFREAMRLNPALAEAHANLGGLLATNGPAEEAVVHCRRAIELKPQFPEAYANLAVALTRQGKLDEAIAACRRAMAMKPAFAAAYTSLGNALRASRRLDEAISAHRHAVELQPESADGYNNLGIALRSSGKLDETIAAFSRAIEIEPKLASAHSNLGVALRDQGLLDEALASWDRAMALEPGTASFHSNRVYTIHFHPGFDAETILREHRQWNQRHAEPLKREILPHANDPTTGRRLKIGYVSPDFRSHPIGRFLLPLFENHDHKSFEIFCYSGVVSPDALTERLRGHADHWRSIAGLSPAETTDLIRRDGIDLLVDLTMHMKENSLLVFARKPAPVQVTYLAYCSTTGLDTMDYRLTDVHLDPSAEEDGRYCEKSIRLPETYWCYQPEEAAPEPGPLPALAAGHITFACLNNFAKVSAPALKAWCDLLRAVPRSRLILHSHEGSHRDRIAKIFAAEGIDTARLQFAGMTQTLQYLQTYQKIDIALDPFPCGGGTTTCDALWMGVPVVSLAGKTGVSRSGVSILSNIGLGELIAQTTGQYVKIAADLAADVERLGKLRSGLRQRMLKSPLMNGPRFAGNIEDAYREMWGKWCESR